MAGFRKADPKQAALKMAIYGQPGSGKTFTSLLIGEGLAKVTGKRMAVVDTERGTDFYAQAIKDRRVHPEAFDFDALYTRALTDVDKSVRELDPKIYSVVVIDSITHLWEAAIAAFSGRETRAGTIPFSAWGKIKKPYKSLISFLINSPMHVIICGRQGVEYGEDDTTGETKKIGVKMKAEGETAYEPHILIRMEGVRDDGNVISVRAIPEKDRTGILAGRIITNPSFETLGRPILPYLGLTQAAMETGEDAAMKDSEQLAAQESERIKTSGELLRKFKAQFDLCADEEARKAVGATITKEVKAQMTTQDVDALREHFRGGTTHTQKAEE